ncbi:MAG: phosphoadenylyl-sulfate reductase [Sinimarinibacterium flocculans]|jgi:phosphoadenosine phosphosulfate reductase|uniref:Adenosine 5'-phosphosulfate reductase n=1 Tax=Sinimarinibacterium flocculans TaxID=985250 RepID=A0A318EGU0_9GAMM|nr:phosphoadenylyl-sulfate reductase [Sinimarinibacterium flocculans]MEC9364791.1 phosphoadenylyl-sulfate reductase [Pseudomonadota bacterium]PXV71448.1 phosphoadenylylsulfate reductase (thioredoxin) [Sinimarinibacterium flocculans]
MDSLPLAAPLADVEAATPDTAASRLAPLDDARIAELNAAYAPLHFEERIRRLYTDFDPAKVLVTSSFAATSAYFLHIISRIRPEQVIHFIDTGYHFPETVQYRQYLIDLFGLKVSDLRAEDWKHQFTTEEQTWKRDPDFCCSVNKVEPLEAVKPNYQVWVSSLMHWQTEHRAGLDIFEVRRGIVKFNPMVDVTREQRDAYIREHDLPFHPLVAQGFQSIGCTHCTVAGDGRSGRWLGKPKTECGLHL